MTFFSNESYRKHIKKLLRHSGLDLSCLDHFTASFATWRYETVCDVFMQLLQIRAIAEHHLREEMFQHVQDRESVQAAILGCKNKQLWRFVSCAQCKVAEPTEKLRRWGMICTCEEHVKMRVEQGVKHIHCWMNSRRLREVYQHAQDKVREARTSADTLTDADAEGDAEVHDIISSLLRAKATELNLRTRYLGCPPWSFSQCDTVEGAKTFLEQVAKYPMEKHDPLTRHWMQTLGQDILTRANGGIASIALLDEAYIVNLAMLDESAGEGVHRADTLEKTRAASSSSTHVKQSTRERQVLEKLKGFIEKYKLRGRRVVRYEYFNWKRLLQTDMQRKWTGPKQLVKQKALARIYREDDKAEEDWSIIAKLAGLEKATGEDTTVDGQLANE